MNQYKKYLPIFVLILASIVIYFAGFNHYFTLANLKMHQAELDALMGKEYTLFVLLFCLTYILVVSFSLPAATFMTIACGFLFGIYVGTCITVISATIGATIIFLSARLASDTLAQKVGNWAAKMQEGFQKNATSYLLTLRLVPLFPFVVVNLVAAFFQVPIRVFVLTTLFGIIPGSITYVYLGSTLRYITNFDTIDVRTLIDPHILLAFTLLGLLSLLPVFYKWYQRKFS